MFEADNVSKEEIQELLLQFDNFKDNNGNINYVEFLKQLSL